MDENNKAISAMAAKIIAHSKRILARSLPFLMPALYLLRDEETQTPGELSADGLTLFYHPETVVANFQSSKQTAINQILHIVLHGLLGHFSKRRGQIPAVFDVIADVKVRQLAMQLGQAVGKKYVSPGNALSADAKFYFTCNAVGSLEKLYLAATEEGPLAQSVALFGPDFCSDDHSRWTRPNAKRPEGDAGFGAGDDMVPLLWQQIGDQVLQSMEKDPNWGSLAGAIGGETQAAEENDISYTDFLLRFAAPKEQQKLDPDAFDRNWYQLGLDLYGDIPLLEPVELTERNCVDQIVIALDTSGSCSGDVMRSFLRETMNLLRDISDGAGSFELLILQCDAKIQSEMTLHTGDDVDDFLTQFEPRGFGGTDFRPVFQRIDRLQKSGQLQAVRGLLYLSDGYGDFPDQPPDYETAFLFPEEEELYASNRDFIPSWVTQVQLTQDDLNLKEDA